jgi:hypothetical protein
VDVELAGYRKVHRGSPEGGALAVALAREDQSAGNVVGLVDRAQAATIDGSEAAVTELGRKLGAVRVLVLATEGGSVEKPERVSARVLEVSRGRYIRAPLGLPVVVGTGVGAGVAAGAAASTASPTSPDLAAQLLAYAVGPADAPDLVAAAAPPVGGPGKKTLPVSIAAKATEKNNAKTEAAAAAATATQAKPPEDKKPAWKKWYTWVAGGAVVLGVGGFVIAQHVGDDQITVHVTH